MLLFASAFLWRGDSVSGNRSVTTANFAGFSGRFSLAFLTARDTHEVVWSPASDGGTIMSALSFSSLLLSRRCLFCQTFFLTRQTCSVFLLAQSISFPLFPDLRSCLGFFFFLFFFFFSLHFP